MADKEITVILPSAGQASRLNLETPKELLEIKPGLRLMDFSLKHILDVPPEENIKITVAVVIQPWKTAVAEYVAKQLAGINVETVIFNHRYKEWPGSVYSAKDVFSRSNLVLLPDSYLSLSGHLNGADLATIDNNGKTLVELVLAALSRHEVVFGCKTCTDKERLKTLGAVRVENGIITAFQDKPQNNEWNEPFNAFWGCYAFKKETGKSLYDFLIHSVLHQPLAFNRQPFYPPGLIPIADYYDLGTWESIEKFREKEKWGHETQTRCPILSPFPSSTAP